MKKITLLSTVVSVASLCISQGALLITGTPITLDFNNLNTNFGGAYDAVSGTTTFPTVDGNSSATTAIYSGTAGTQFTVSDDDFNPGGVYSNTGSYSNSNSIRALRDGVTSDYAIGVKDSADRFFTLILQNDTGTTVTSWDVSYAIEQYSKGASPTIFSFDYSLNGTTFVTTNLVGAANVVADITTPVDTNLASVLRTARTGTINEIISDQAFIYLRWKYDHVSGTSNHMGIDDITVAAIPEPASALLGTIGLLGLLRRRR